MRIKLLRMYFYFSVILSVQKDQIIRIRPDKIGIIGFSAEDMVLQYAVNGSMAIAVSL